MTKGRQKRGDRETARRIIESYIHDGRIGAIVEVNCETSFVAKTEEIKDLAHKLAFFPVFCKLHL